MYCILILQFPHNIGVIYWKSEKTNKKKETAIIQRIDSQSLTTHDFKMHQVKLHIAVVATISD